MPPFAVGCKTRPYSNRCYFMFRRIFTFLIILLIISPCTLMGADSPGPVTLKTIKIETEARLLQVGSECFFKAVGLYSDGSERNITDEVEWISVNRKIGRFADADKGMLTVEAAGSTLVFARLHKIRSSGVKVRVEPATRPVLKVSPLKIDLGNVEGNKSKEFSISIKNIGSGDLSWEIRSDAPWLVANHDFSRDAYALWLEAWMKNIPEPIDIYGDEKMDQLPPETKPVSYDTWRAEREGLLEKLNRGETDSVTITAYTVDLPDWEYKGTIFVTSDVERKEIEVLMKVVSLEYIFITPVSIKVRTGQKRRFGAVGIWSDGSRTDLSESSDGQWVVSDPSVGKFLYDEPVFVAKKTGETEIRKIRGGMVSSIARVEVEEGIARPVLAVSPREIDLGAIGPGESTKGVFSLKNFGSGILNWSANGPSGWSLSGKRKLSSVMRNTPRKLRIYLKSLKKDDEESWEDFELYPIQLRLESGGNFVTYVKNLSAGNHREMIKLTSDGGMRRVFLKFEVTQAESTPSIKVEPLGMDVGIIEPGKQLVRKVKLRNEGKDVLKWKARLQRNRKTFAGMPLKKGRYISLSSEDARGKGTYTVPVRLKDSVDVSGVWLEDEGYPYSYAKDNILKYSFSGTGVAVFVWRDFDGGKLAAYIDDKLMKEIDCLSEEKERKEFLVAEGLEEGEHVLTLVSHEGYVVIEGIRVYSKDIMKGSPGWMKINPDTGTTTKETDYVNIMINSRGLKSGYYSENVLFSSNGGAAVVMVSLQVSKDEVSKTLNIYRYVRGSDYLFTANPELEDQDFLEGYKKQGIAFRLFSKGTPGTISFFRWYNPSKGDHFYSCEKDGGGKSLGGYVFEGAIGNIATIRLPRTKELYRWFNLSSGVYFYTTDPKGEGCSERGYKYDGIAGYVR